MKYFLGEYQKVISEFQTGMNTGLNDRQVELHRQKYGINQLTKQKPESIWKRLWDAATEPIILMLIAAGVIALGINLFRLFTAGQPEFLEVVGIFTAITISVTISVIIEGRSAKAFEALSEISNNTIIKALRGGNTMLLSQENLVCGDIVLLSTGDKIPADCRLIACTELRVNESALTGESVPVKKAAEFVTDNPKTPLAERHNMLYSGTFITEGHCKAIVCAVGDQTEFGKIAGALKDEKKSTPLQEKLTKLGKTITLLGLIAAGIVFITEVVAFAIRGCLSMEAVTDALVTSIVLVVAAAPEGLPTIVAVSLSINIIKLARQNTLVKKMIASETVGCINVICSDKTGTLTENRMTVNRYFDDKEHTDPTDLTNQWLIRNICANSTADLDEHGGFIGNPTECAMLNMVASSRYCEFKDKTYKDERAAHTILQVFPFSSDLKHMTTIARRDGETFALVKGSPECVLAMCDIEPEKLQKIRICIRSAEDQAMRLIAFAHKNIETDADFSDEATHQKLESNMVFDGFVAISDPLRKEVYNAVDSCRRAGIALKILTGDNIHTATAIARELKLLDDEHIAVEAKAIEEYSDEKLAKMLPKIAVIARSTPSIKMRVVKCLKAQGNVVAVTGDGINDAPALKNADVGIAMGIAGTEVSKAAADIVLLDDSFATIIKAVEWGRNIYENFKRFISFQLTVNLASVIVVFTSIILGYDAPFTALQLLWINLIMDGPPALTLGLEPNYEDMMERQPTKRGESIISKLVLIRIVIIAVYESIFVLGQYFFNYLNVPQEQMYTVLFTMFVLFQLFNAFNCRELYNQSIFKHFFGNRIMLWVVGGAFVLQVTFIQYAGSFFRTVPLPLDLWIKLFVITASVVVGFEIVKIFWRKLDRRDR